MLPDGVALAHQAREFHRAAGLAQHQQPSQHGQPAAAGDQKRLPGRLPRFLAFVVEPDQQIRSQAGQFPEHVQREHVVGQDDSQHRGHEHQQEGIEPSQVPVSGKIAAGIDDDERADAADEQREQQAETVQVEGEFNA